MITRDYIIKEAKSWIGTRFHHQGRVKKKYKNYGGCDCLGLIIGVAKELNIGSGVYNKNGEEISLYKFDRTDYRRIPGSHELYVVLMQLMLRKNSKLKIGDVILFKIQNRLQHLAFYSYNHSIIHSLAETRRVTEHKLNNYWEARIDSVFSFKGIS